jgi:hypothetical protein
MIAHRYRRTSTIHNLRLRSSDEFRCPGALESAPRAHWARPSRRALGPNYYYNYYSTGPQISKTGQVHRHLHDTISGIEYERTMARGPAKTTTQIRQAYDGGYGSNQEGRQECASDVTYAPTTLCSS